MCEKKLNATAWDNEAMSGNYWTRPVSEGEVSKAKNGDLRIWLTPSKMVKKSWISGTKGKKVLLLASGGGQQSVLLSAYGAHILSIDISKEQIRRDLDTLRRFGLDGEARIGDMCDLRDLEDSSFDYVFIPHSINFISNLDDLYSGVSRVLKEGGHLLFGSANPVLYIFDEKKEKRGKLKVKYTLPFSDEKSKSKKEIRKMIKAKDTFESSHTLSSILSPLFEKGFILVDFYSDESLNETVDSFIHDSFLAFNFAKCRF